MKVFGLLLISLSILHALTLKRGEMAMCDIFAVGILLVLIG